VEQPTTIVGHLAPDLDCLAAMWILIRFGGATNAELRFVPSGTTLDQLPVDSNPLIIHVDTGGGRFDHHRASARQVSAAELVRRKVAPDDLALERMVRQVSLLDNAMAPAQQGYFSINSLIQGFNTRYPTDPEFVARTMFLNLDAWYEQELRQVRLEAAFAQRIEFQTFWGLGIAMECDDGGSSRLAYQRGAVLYAYRDGQGWMGIAAQARSSVDLSTVYADLRLVDGEADWYLHPNKRLLLCGTPKAPPRVPSRLTLEQLVRVIQGEAMFGMLH
jgi:hypothetical protein